MKLHIARGAKFGGWSALLFTAVTPINNLIRHEPVAWEKVAIGAAFVFVIFGLVGTFTDRFSSEMSDA